MKLDRSLKVVLTLIAIALWMIVVKPWLQPSAVSAQSKSSLQQMTDRMILDSSIQDVKRSVWEVGHAVDEIAQGRCLNKKICDGGMPGIHEPESSFETRAIDRKLDQIASSISSLESDVESLSTDVASIRTALRDR